MEDILIYENILDEDEVSSPEKVCQSPIVRKEIEKINKNETVNVQTNNNTDCKDIYESEYN